MSSLEVLRRERDERQNQAAVAVAAAKFDFTAPKALEGEAGALSGGYTIPKGRKYDIRRKKRHRERAAHLQGNMPVQKWNHFYGMYGNVPGSFMLKGGRTPLIMMPNPYLARSLLMSTLPAVEHDNRQLTDMASGLRSEPSIISTSRQIEDALPAAARTVIETLANAAEETFSGNIEALLENQGIAPAEARRLSGTVMQAVRSRIGARFGAAAGTRSYTRSQMDETATTPRMNPSID